MKLRTPILLAALLCLPTAGRAEFVPGPVDERGAITFLFENDIFGAQGDDRHYTQGMRLSYLSREENVWDWVQAFARKVPFYPEDGRMRATYSPT